MICMGKHYWRFDAGCAVGANELAMKSSKKNKFPAGWTETRVRGLIRHYEGQSDIAAAREDAALFDPKRPTMMRIPARLVPAVRKLLQRKAS
jgi:hypothetical protein